MIKFLPLGAILICLLGWPNFAAFAAKPNPAPTPWPVKTVLQIDLNGTINPSILRQLQEGLKEAPHPNLILIKLNTPGGLLSTTRDFLTALGDLHLPWVVWIAPAGASATSAGAIIAAGAQVIVAAEGTNIGAATPIDLSGNSMQKDLRKKVINDMVAQVQAMAAMHGRNAKAFEEMIAKASSFAAPQALREHVIDHIVNQESELWTFLHQHVVHLDGKSLKLEIASAPQVVTPQLSWGTQFLQVIAHPELAYILFLLALGLFYLEFHTGGTMVVAGFGVICLILAGMSFQVLPINFGGVGLIVLGAILLGLEIFITSYGLLAISGILALAIGSILVFNTADAYLQIPYSFFLATCLILLLLFGILVYLIVRDIRRGGDFFSLKTADAVIVGAPENSPFWQVRVRGEVWQAKIQEGTPHIGESWEIVDEDRKQMVLTIKPKIKD